MTACWWWVIASQIKVHVHTDEPGTVLALATARGTLHAVEIDNMKEQTEARDRRLREPGIARSRRPVRIPAQGALLTQVVAVVAGEGNKKLFRSMGASILVEGGQTMNPSAEELLQAVRSATTPSVIVLPNNKNIVMTADQIVGLVEKEVLVVPTRSMLAGLAAMVAFDPLIPGEDNRTEMQGAYAGLATAEVTRAVRDSRINGLQIKPGHVHRTAERTGGRRLRRLPGGGGCGGGTPHRRGAGSGDRPARQQRVGRSYARGGSATERTLRLGGDGDTRWRAAAVPAATVGRVTSWEGKMGREEKATRLDRSNTAILVDSTADLPPYLAEDSERVHDPADGALRGRCVPGLDRHRTQAVLRQSSRRRPNFPTTSQPSVGAFIQEYQRLRATYEHVYSLHLSALMSGTIASATLAAEEVDGVTVIDTLDVCHSISLLTDRLLVRLDRGTTHEEFMAYVEHYRKNRGMLFLLATLDYIYKGGRIGRASHLMGGLLNVKPILTYVDGNVEPYKKVRGDRKALEAMRDYFVERTVPGKPVYRGHRAGRVGRAPRAPPGDAEEPPTERSICASKAISAA